MKQIFYRSDNAIDLNWRIRFLRLMQSAIPDIIRAIQAMLAEKDAAIAERQRIIADKEALLTERERVIAVRDAELYAKTLQIEHLKMQLARLRRKQYEIGRASCRERV